MQMDSVIKSCLVWSKDQNFVSLVCSVQCIESHIPVLDRSGLNLPYYSMLAFVVKRVHALCVQELVYVKRII